MALRSSAPRRVSLPGETDGEAAPRWPPHCASGGRVQAQPRGTRTGEAAGSRAAGARASEAGAGLAGGRRGSSSPKKCGRAVVAGAEPLSGGPIVEQMSKRARQGNEKEPQVTRRRRLGQHPPRRTGAALSDRAPFFLQPKGQERRLCEPEGPLGGVSGRDLCAEPRSFLRPLPPVKSAVKPVGGRTGHAQVTQSWEAVKGRMATFLSASWYYPSFPSSLQGTWAILVGKS